MAHTEFLTFLAMRGLVRFILGLVGSISLLTGLVLIVLSLSNGGVSRGLLGFSLIGLWWLALYIRFTYDRAILRHVPSDCTFTLMP
jgi:hypothetical protein